MQKTRMVPEDDIFDKINDGDLVEVYFTDHTPMFRSLEYYRHFTFTLDDSLCLRWYQLCARDLIVNFKWMRFVLKYLKKGSPQTLEIPIGEHYIDEKSSEKLLRFLCWNKYLSGAVKEGKLASVVCVSEIRPVGEKGKLWK